MLVYQRVVLLIFGEPHEYHSVPRPDLGGLCTPKKHTAPMNILGHSHFTIGHSHFNAQIGLELEHALCIVLYTLAIGFAHGL